MRNENGVIKLSIFNETSTKKFGKSFIDISNFIYEFCVEVILFKIDDIDYTNLLKVL